MNDAQNVRGRAQGMSVQELMDAIEPLLNSIAMGEHDPLCRIYSGFPDIAAKSCNCTWIEGRMSRWLEDHIVHVLVGIIALLLVLLSLVGWLS